MTEVNPHPDLSLYLPPEEFEKEGEIISIYVNSNHPLLHLKQALPWEAIGEVMVRGWLIVCAWYCTQEREAYLAENVVARVFISRYGDPTPQIRDHSNIARAYAS